MKNLKKESSKSSTLRKAPFKIKEMQIIGHIIKYMARSKKKYFSFNEIFTTLNKHHDIHEKQLNTFLESMFYEFGIMVKRTNKKTEDTFQNTYWGLIWKAGLWANGVKEY